MPQEGARVRVMHVCFRWLSLTGLPQTVVSLESLDNDSVHSVSSVCRFCMQCSLLTVGTFACLGSSWPYALVLKRR